MIKKIYGKIISTLAEKKHPSLSTSDRNRLLLVIKARWLLIGMLLIYGILTSGAYLVAYVSSAKGYSPAIFTEALRIMVYPGLIVFMLAAYNAIYHISWHRLPQLWSKNVKSLIFAQLAADIPIVLFLIHFTGGINSWFWTLFLVLNLELTYLLTTNWQIISIGALTGAGFSILTIMEHYGILEAYQLPFLTPVLHSSTYLVLMLLWVNLISGFSCIVSIFLHRSEHKELKERIVKDALTGLYNRRYFSYRLNSEIQRAQRYGSVVSLILFDLDNFKDYNDKYGHNQGDALLRWIAGVFKLNIRRSDKEPSYEIDIACRYGGEEFAIILPETTGKPVVKSLKTLKKELELQTNGAVALADRVRKTIAATRTSTNAKMTISAGIAIYPADGRTEKELVEAADKALYKAKESGKNKIVVAESRLRATGT